MPYKKGSTREGCRWRTEFVYKLPNFPIACTAATLKSGEESLAAEYRQATVASTLCEESSSEEVNSTPSEKKGSSIPSLMVESPVVAAIRVFTLCNDDVMIIRSSSICASDPSDAIPAKEDHYYILSDRYSIMISCKRKTPWRNGSAPDSRSVGWGFESLWGHNLFFFPIKYLPHPYMVMFIL